MKFILFNGHKNLEDFSIFFCLFSEKEKYTQKNLVTLQKKLLAIPTGVMTPRCKFMLYNFCLFSLNN